MIVVALLAFLALADPEPAPMSLSVNRWAEPTHDQLDSLLDRVHSIKGLPELDNAIVESFVRCARHRDCSPAGR